MAQGAPKAGAVTYLGTAFLLWQEWLSQSRAPGGFLSEVRSLVGAWEGLLRKAESGLGVGRQLQVT